LVRNLVDREDGILHGDRYFIHDRDPLFTQEFRQTLAGAGVISIKLPPRSPNLNVYAERFVRSIREECLDRMVIFGERGLRKAITQYADHYHWERNHQGLGNRLLLQYSLGHSGTIRRSQRLGGTLNYYYREAA
jgi:putative transposase